MKTVLKMLAICMMAGGLGVQSVYAEPLVIQEQGSFSAGGTIITAPGTFDAKKPLDSAGQTYHGDHASVFYQIPENPHKYPIVMLHGAGQSSRTWESTPDGREGFQNIFLRRGFSTYIVDQPRRGDAGRTTVEGTVTPKPDEQMWFNQFRVGVWPDYFKGVQFSHDKEALNQYFRQMTPNTGPFDVNVISDAMSAVVDKSGPAILFTHSQGGGPGWYTAMKNNKVKAIVAFEPGSGFVFPEKELPAPMPSAFDTLKGEPVPMEQFMALTKIPILIIYGDNIPDKPVAMPAQDSWRVRLAMARKWRDVVNKHGGDGLLCSLLYQAFNVTEALAFAVLKRSLAYRRAVKKVIMPAQGPQQNVDSLFRVAKCINQQRKSRRMLLTAGIVKVISGKSWTPLL